VTRQGRSIVYTGFQWRGRSTVGSSEESALREVMTVDRDWKDMSGRWFRGSHDEFGLDVTLRRLGRDVEVTGAGPEALKTGVESRSSGSMGRISPPRPRPRRSISDRRSSHQRGVRRRRIS
jgi:quinohemoprotein amine dehydrogenase